MSFIIKSYGTVFEQCPSQLYFLYYACQLQNLQKIAKRKKIHSFKSKMRMEQLEVTQNKRQNAWQQFQTTKGKTKKVLLVFMHFIVQLL